MELRRYWRVFVRRWWLAAGITLATAVISFIASPLTQGGYTASLRVLLGVQAEPGSGYFRYNNYYGILSSEYLTDDFIEVARSQSFKDKVLQEMRPAPQSLSVSAQPRSERAPRIVTIIVTAANEDEARRGGEAAVRVATARIGEYFPQMASGATAILIDPPAVTPPGAAGRNYVNILLRTLAGLIVGLGLVFLLHYLDDKLYDAADVERHLGIPVLAEVPKGSRLP